MMNLRSRSSAVLPMLIAAALFVLAPDVKGEFTTIINIPPDPAIGDNQSIASVTQLNLGDGGSIGEQFEAGFFNGSSTNIEVNISGGTVGDSFNAVWSTVNISGGTVGNGFNADQVEASRGRQVEGPSRAVSRGKVEGKSSWTKSRQASRGTKSRDSHLGKRSRPSRGTSRGEVGEKSGRSRRAASTTHSGIE